MDFRKCFAALLPLLIITQIPIYLPGAEAVENRTESNESHGILVNSTEHKTINDEALLMHGNITVSTGGSLRISNSTIQFNSSANITLNIFVEEGGNLTINHSSVNSTDIYGYNFIVFGNLTTDNCSFADINQLNDSEVSGIRIHSDNVILNNTRISVSGYNSSAVVILNSSAVITNSSFYGEGSAFYLRNGSHVKISQSVISSGNSQGRGIFCTNSSFNISGTEFNGNQVGLYANSGAAPNYKGKVANCSFNGNQFGFFVSPDSGLNTKVNDSHFSSNSIAAMILLDDTNVENCSFTDNVWGNSQDAVAAVAVAQVSGKTNVSVRNSSFEKNRNGIFFLGGNLEISDNHFQNNTAFEGRTGLILNNYENDSSVSVEGCNFTENLYGIDAYSSTNRISTNINNNTFQGNVIGFRVSSFNPNIVQNIFDENKCAVEERYSNQLSWQNNTFNENMVEYRWILRVNVSVEDGYGVPLDRTKLNFSPLNSREGVIQEFQTNANGNFSGDIFWEEHISDSIVSYHPYELKVTYKGASNTTTLNKSKNISLTMIIPFKRPELHVSNLLVKNREFYLYDDKPRKGDEAEIEFTIKNKGEGKAENASLMVMVDGYRLTAKDINLLPGESKDFSISWTPDKKGKTNIVVRASHTDQLEYIDNDLDSRIEVGDSESNYYYVVVLLAVLAIAGMVFWISGQIEGADKKMGQFIKKLKLSIAGMLEGTVRRLRGEKELEPSVEEKEEKVVPAGDITSWDGGATMSGSGRYKPWLIAEENIKKYGNPTDIVTIRRDIPVEEPEEPVPVEPETETFEWLSGRGETRQVTVDKQTLLKFNHPKIYICSLCDRTFISVEANAKCPWCAGKAIFLQDM